VGVVRLALVVEVTLKSKFIAKREKEKPQQKVE